ncbi:MAG: Stk1 family PASTA domain-containing Ser/Thr kinase [Cohnella sp.]|uniref:Stk1 family PASTA domain-containing Ser/Thr kinase n=1 Tax=Cohnella sp. TaxID=1883426 RepID=UPI000E369C3B|nr:Stk1 family PASTA domain-containing Ser/Thr kinase [Cohnella sp.]REK67154.1 MAG: Stk1 family PASTA domain-containing Ser/Thr kinase [Cohnella sp.]
MIGHTLGGRYELLDRIGGGGMALVYKAKDNLLNRYVAVKVLRQQFMHDDEFVRRFRREAQAAASLSHPNIVSIYDVGQEDDVHYIVMEYVNGHNLNEIIRERAPLQVEEAVRIASQICDALDHAHQNQIIHRDIKPHNILIGNNGRVKVTDFGIARAVTSSTITQTGSVVGSVHYFSPEHAKGVATGEKSDIYSLGIVLYQMLTGRLPFLGESPISVALKHLQEPFEQPRLVNPHIPQSVENIIVRAMRKNPHERYGSAKRMLADLETCLLPERLNEPPLSFDSDEDEEEEQTRAIPALKPEMRMSGQETAARKEPEPKEEEEEEEPKRRWVMPTVLSVLSVVLIGILIWAIMTLRGQLSPDDVEVPTVVGYPLEQAQQMLENAGLEGRQVATEPSSDYDPGVVIKQNKQDMAVKKGAVIELTVSSGPELVEMPKVEGESYDEAVEKLVGLGFDRDKIAKNETHDKSDPGTVIDQSPEEGTELNPETDTIELTVSLGEESFLMPNLIGMTLSEAKAAIMQKDLVLPKENIIYEPSYTTENKVFKQLPTEQNEMVTAGTEVKIWVSSGYPADAKTITYNVTVPPAAEGVQSKIRIVYSDARGDNIEWGTQKITRTETFPVTLVLSPSKQGKITVYRDDQFLADIPIPYEDTQTSSFTVDPSYSEGPQASAGEPDRDRNRDKDKDKDKDRESDTPDTDETQGD